MLWYEELCLMFLAAPDTCRLDVAEVGVAACPAGRQEKHLLWWDLVKKFSRYDGNRRRQFLEQIRAQIGLPEDWNAVYAAEIRPAAAGILC